MTQTKITYTKLRDGSWGLRGPSLTAGVTVAVSKKDGSQKHETVGRVIWQGDGVCLATIDSCRDSSPRTSSRRPSSGRNVREVYRRRYGWDGVVGSSSYYTSGLYDEES